MLANRWEIIKDDIFEHNGSNKNIFLYEDMYQAKFDTLVIDCGWYGEENNGVFITYLIRDNDWDNPIVKLITTKIEDAKQSIQVCSNWVGNVSD